MFWDERKQIHWSRKIFVVLVKREHALVDHFFQQKVWLVETTNHNFSWKAEDTVFCNYRCKK